MNSPRGLLRPSSTGLLSPDDGRVKVFLRRCANAVRHLLRRWPWVRRWLRSHRPEIEVREATEAEWAALLNARDFPCGHVDAPASLTRIVAAVGGRLVGSVILSRLSDEPGHRDHWLFSLLIDDARWRGLGLGELLTRAVLDQARADGAPCVYLLVAEDNVAALRLYRKLGFGPAPAPPPTVPDLGESYLLLACSLGQAENVTDDVVTTP